MSVATPRPHRYAGVELVREWHPAGAPRAAFVMIHGIAEHSGRYEHVGERLASAGFLVRGFDLIGHGATGGRRCDIDEWDRFFDQIEGHVAEMREQGLPVVLMGHSMGATLALGCVIRRRTPPDLVVASVPALTGGARWQRAIAPVLARLAPTLPIPQRLRGEQLSRDPAVGERYFADPLVYTRGTPRLGLAFFRFMEEVASRASEIDLPVLVLHGGLDTIVPPQSSAPLADLPGFERRLYPNLRHEILNEPEGPQVVDDIVAWVDARL